MLTFKVAPNYEAPTDVLVSNPSSAAGNNEYIVIISATGGAECPGIDSDSDGDRDGDGCD